MLIYKYTSLYAGKLIVENGSLRFSQPDVLNDLFELRPSLDEFTISIRDFVANEPIFLANTKGMAIEEIEAKIDEIVEGPVEELQRQIRSSVILSLTKNPDHGQMWSYYADSYKGIVLGFDYESHFFHQVGHSLITQARDVIYSDKRPVFFNFKDFWEGNISIDDYRNMLLTKESKWVHEDEVRMFADPAAASRISGKDKDGFDVYLYDFPADCLKRIVFGSRMSRSDKTELADTAKKRYPWVELFEVVEDPSAFRLTLLPYKD